MTPCLRALALILLAAPAAQAGTLYDLGGTAVGASSAPLRLTGPLRLVGSKTTLSTYRFDADPILSHLKKSSADATVEFEVSKYGVINSTTQPAARWTRSTALATVDTVNITVTFPNRVYNTQSIFAVSTATVPVGAAGIYRVACTVGFATDNNGRRAVWAEKNGTLITGCKTMIPAVASDETIITGSCTPYLAEGDAVTCRAFQSSGSGINITAGSIEVVKLW